MIISERRISKGPEGGLWRGPDIEAAETVVIPPNQIISVPFTLYPHHLPPISLFDPQAPRDSSGLHFSMRSRWAQLGINAETSVIYEIADASTKRNGHRSFIAEIPIKNHGARAVKIVKGAKVFRLYSYSKEQTARGSELGELVEKGDIKIEGREGIDWEWDRNEKGAPVGIYVVIRPDSIMWIPPDSNAQPLVVDERVHDYRQVINTLLQPAPLTDKPILWIAETPKITLSTSVDAILAREVVIFGEGGLPVATELIQINSRLVDRRKTDWPVRLEIVGPTAAIGGDKLAYVRFSFMKR